MWWSVCNMDMDMDMDEEVVCVRPHASRTKLASVKLGVCHASGRRIK